MNESEGASRALTVGAKQAERGEEIVESGDDRSAIREVTPQMFAAMLENQKQDLELRKMDSDRERQKLDIEGLNIRTRDKYRAQEFRSQRFHARLMRRDGYKFYGVIGILLAIVLITALFLNKETFAMEVVKDFVLVLCGGAGGYGIARNQKSGPELLPEGGNDPRSPSGI